MLVVKFIKDQLPGEEHIIHQGIPYSKQVVNIRCEIVLNKNAINDMPEEDIKDLLYKLIIQGECNVD